jgi:TolB-like protein
MSARLLFMFAMSVSLLGCSSVKPDKSSRIPIAYEATRLDQETVNQYENANRYPLLSMTQQAADKLNEQISKTLTPPGPLVMATLVNINNLEMSSAFGRTIAEQVSAGLTRNGFQIIEVKYRSSLYLKRNQGELALSLELKDLARSNSAQGVVAGTYSVGKDLVFVTLKVVHQKENIVLASYSFALPLDNNILSLLEH